MKSSDGKTKNLICCVMYACDAGKISFSLVYVEKSSSSVYDYDSKCDNVYFPFDSNYTLYSGKINNNRSRSIDINDINEEVESS